MNPQDQNQPGYPANPAPGYPGQAPPPQQPVHNPLSVMQPGEQVICEIKRHPIGIFGMYFVTGFFLIVLAVVIFAVTPNFITTVSQSQIYAVGGLLFIIATLLAMVFVYIGNKVYWGNRWIVTSDSLTQVTQRSLFDKQSSQLSLGNLEDVTASQDGPLAHMFNYGLLRVETAGERSKFVFVFCPNPNEYAKQILGAREQFEQGRRGDDLQRTYRSENAYQPPQPGQPAQPAPGGYPNPNPPTNPMPPSYGDNQDGGVNVNTEQ